MMMYETVKAAIIALLVSKAAGRFRVVGSQVMGANTEEFIGNDRCVRVFNRSKQFPENRSLNGPYQNDVSVDLQFITSAEAAVNLAVLNDPSSTPAEIIAALNARENASDLADNSYDEFTGLVFSILMDATAQDFGLADYTIDNRWYTGDTKSDTETHGDLQVLTGIGTLKFSVEETVSGATPTPVDKHNGTIMIKDDPNVNTEVENNG